MRAPARPLLQSTYIRVTSDNQTAPLILPPPPPRSRAELLKGLGPPRLPVLQEPLASCSLAHLQLTPMAASLYDAALPRA